MKILVIKATDAAEPLAFVANTKKELFHGDAALTALIASCAVWRYHDGSGWADESSAKAFEAISYVPRKAILMGV